MKRALWVVGLGMLLVCLATSGCSCKPAATPAPDVTGQTLSTASVAIIEAGFTIGTITEQCSNTVAAGSVVSQTPAPAEQIPPGSVVTLVVSTGLCNVTVPNVVGQTQSTANAALTILNLNTGSVTQQCSNTIALGLVISQTPTAGVQAPFGSAVALVISAGPCNVSVPGVIGQAQSAAAASITAVGLTVGSTTQLCSNTVAAELVVSQTPTVGEQVQFGSAVALVISTGACDITVPNVVGLTQSAAESALANLNLTIGAVTQQCSNTIAAGIVISQTPVAGEQASSGSAVALVISTGPCYVTVPDIVGQTQPAAFAAITSAGLTVGVVTQECSEIAEELVVRQMPEAGQQVVYGSAVTFVISTGPCSGNETIMLEGDVPLEMVWVPAVKFLMGSPDNEQGRRAEEGPQHQVTLTYGFWIGKYEVTQAQWRAVMGWSNNPSYFLGDNRPVGNVSWVTITKDFIPALKTMTGLRFRLPSEAEWEYACRARMTTRFYWGNDLNYTDVENYAWYYDNSDSQTHDVGAKRPNGFGLYDMIGNVREWCQDWYGSYASGSETDPTGPNSGSEYVTRGGDYTAYDYRCRSACRNSASPESSNPGVNVGFRLCRSDGPKPASVPNVIGMTHTTAQTAIAFEDLTVGTVTFDFSETMPAGEIFSQEPVSGTRVALGSTVNLVVSRGRHSTNTELIVLSGDVILTMVWVPGETFLMGSPDSEQGRLPDEGPQHQVTLPHGFWMGNYEVTQAQWTAVMGILNNPSHDRGPNRPVESVSWNQVTGSFIPDLNTYITNTGQGPATFRLPTEAEWEYACRAGETLPFYWGSDPNYSYIGNYAWYSNNSNLQTHDVGLKLPNVFGLYDITGNVWEWCQDWYGSYSGDPVTDPIGPASGMYRVSRGGSASYTGNYCRSACRDYRDPSGAAEEVGFRLCK